jgi:[protein-PII] uridylyltransferase
MQAFVVHIPEPVRLKPELTRIAGLPRTEAVAALKTLRTTEFATIAAWQQTNLGESTGQDVVGALSALADAIVRSLAQRAATKVGAPVGWEDHVGILAIGGYGRGEMNPYSDLDLLVLAVGKQPPSWLSPFWNELQTLLWDVKFAVGASQRNAAELSRLIEEDFVTATAVIEWRPLLAGPAVRVAMHELLEGLRAKRGTEFLKYKLMELGERRAKAGASLFLMEPNLKSNPGGLRDVQLLRTMAWAVSGRRDLLALTELDSITRADLSEVNAAEDHLLTLRSLLHFHHGRKVDVFQLPDQVRIAKLYGWADVSRLRAVEHFMKRHYALVRHVHQIVDLAISRLTALGHLGRRPILIKSRKAIDDDFVIVQDHVYLAHRQFWAHPDAGARLLHLAREAQRREVRFSLELQREIRANLHRIDEGVRRDRQLARIFLELLGDLGRTHDILSDMHACGLLGAYLPEFGNLTCLMQFDSYHQYTVDEHTLIAMGNLDQVALGKAAGLPGMSRLLPQVARKDLLALSLLLHDMGKYMGRGHVARGAIMVEQVAERFGLNDTEEDFVYFLVERHVSLSDASRMRDFHEPEFLAAFAAKMGTIENLNALYCLTWCDAKAVGDGIMTGWQEAILAELREAVAQQLAGGAAPGTRHQRLMAELAVAKVPHAAATEFLASLDHTYEHQVQPGDIARHFQVFTEAATLGIGMAHEVVGKTVHLTAAIPDRRGLLASIASTLSGHGFDIIDCRTWVTTATASRAATVIYSFRLSSLYPARLGEEELWTRLRRDLLAVEAGKLDPRTLLDKRRAALVPRPADSGFDDPAVKVEQRTSHQATIVDIHTKDEVGLLSKLTLAITESGCDIGYACINTMGDVAVDVFYVYRNGKKLTDAEAEDLRTHLVRTLNLNPVVRDHG